MVQLIMGVGLVGLVVFLLFTVYVSRLDAKNDEQLRVLMILGEMVNDPDTTPEGVTFAGRLLNRLDQYKRGWLEGLLDKLAKKTQPGRG
jgi:hypothetical protein